jgi:hypothetical protein
MEKRTIEISLETAKEWYKGDNQKLRNLALEAFNETELKAYCVRSWDEFCEQYIISEGEYYIDIHSDINNIKDSICRDHIEDRNLLATKEDAEAFLALMQLKRLRDQWWESLKWKADYTDDKTSKYVIILVRDKIKLDAYYLFSSFLAFPTEEIAKDFLDCFRDLIEKAKELI